jgi:hypothetical protein
MEIRDPCIIITQAGINLKEFPGCTDFVIPWAWLEDKDNLLAFIAHSCTDNDGWLTLQLVAGIIIVASHYRMGTYDRQFNRE